MARSNRKTMGTGAVITVLLKMIHPSKHIRDKFPNLSDKQRLEGALVIQRELKTINRREQESIVFRHEEFDNIELYASQRFCKIVEEGPATGFFGDGEEAKEAAINTNNDSDMIELTDAVARMVTTSSGNQRNFDSNEIEQICQEVAIDNDNEPLPENLGPTVNTNEAIFEREWGHDGICPRRLATNNTNPEPQLNVVFNNRSRVELFEAFFMKDFIKNTLLVNINNNIDGTKVSYGEFLRWLGLWFLMSTIIGPSRRAFFSKKSSNEFSDAPFRVYHYMSHSHFTAILDSIVYTTNDPPEYKDRFWEIRDMLEAWNANIVKVFGPGSVN